MRKKPPAEQRSRPRTEARERSESVWQIQKKHGPFSGKNIFSLKTGSMSVTNLQQALDYLAHTTGDEAFRTASLVLKAYDLKGGLQREIRRLLRDAGLTPENHAVLFMHGPHMQDAELIAAKLGVPGQSFDSVVTKLRKIRVAFGKEPSRTRDLPVGDTGRRLLVYLMPVFGADGSELPRRLFGIDADADGLAVVPDTRVWRRAIAHGSVVILLGYLNDDPWGSWGTITEKEREGFKRKTWKKFIQKNPSN